MYTGKRFLPSARVHLEVWVAVWGDIWALDTCLGGSIGASIGFGESVGLSTRRRVWPTLRYKLG